MYTDISQKAIQRAEKIAAIRKLIISVNLMYLL
jgi:hypothetical protein